MSHKIAEKGRRSLADSLAVGMGVEKQGRHDLGSGGAPEIIIITLSPSGPWLATALIQLVLHQQGDLEGVPGWGRGT